MTYGKLAANFRLDLLGNWRGASAVAECLADREVRGGKSATATALRPDFPLAIDAKAWCSDPRAGNLSHLSGILSVLQVLCGPSLTCRWPLPITA